MARFKKTTIRKEGGMNRLQPRIPQASAVGVCQPFNPAYYRAHNDICKRRDTKRLYFSPLRIDLPHGRGAGATSFCAIEALIAVEKSVQENKKPRKTQRELPYHTAKQNDTTKLCNVLFICPEPGFVDLSVVLV